MTYIPSKMRYSQDIEAFSTDEVITDKYWYDGKPIYRTVYNMGGIGTNTSASAAHGISNLDTIVNIKGIAERGDGNGTLSLPYINPTGASAFQYDILIDNYPSTHIRIITGTSQSISGTMVTLEYTKTTDSTGTIPAWTYPSGSGYIDAYSTDEFKTNKYYYNGKPIYKKIVDFGALPNSTRKQVTAGITGEGFDRIINITGFASRSDSGAGFPIPHSTTSSSNNVLVQFVSSTDDIRIETATDWSVYDDTIIFIEYTKTSSPTGDIPESAPRGDGIIYKTTEVDTGDKWIDGKPIYRKVVDIGNISTGGAYVNTMHGISDLDTVIGLRAFGKRGDSNGYQTIPYIHPSSFSSFNNCCLIDIYPQTTIRIIPGSIFSLDNVFAIIEYTKTTD